ncbi:MAG: transcription termination/antitermination protein NusG [Mycoplasmoidaceae bacterium]
MNKNINKPQWYIATTIMGSEESIYLSLLDKIKAYKFDDLVQEMRMIKYNDITIETFRDGSNPPPKTMRNTKNITWETTPDGRYIKKTYKSVNKFPGYIFICMIMTDEVWYAIRNTPGVTGFIGSSGKGAQPIPISEFELSELFDPEKNKDIIRHVNAASVSIEEVEHVMDENPIKPKSDIEFFNSRATSSAALSQTRKIDFERRTNQSSESDIDMQETPHEKIIEDKIHEENEKEIIIEKPIVDSEESKNVSKFETPTVIETKQKEEKISKNDSLNEFVVGNTVQIIAGPFQGQQAIITKIDTVTGELHGEIDFFGRSNEIKLKKSEVTK